MSHSPAMTSLPFSAVVEVLGRPVRVESNHADLLMLAAGSFPLLGFDCANRSAEAVLRLSALATDEPEDCPPIFYGRTGGRLEFACGASNGFADRASGIAVAWIGSSLLADPDRARTDVIECLALFLAGRWLPAALHAAAVAQDGRCLLLTGAAGAGKSTLAFACLLEGLQLVAEDVVFVDTSAGRPVAHGLPGRIHLLPDARRFFPECPAARPVRRGAGEDKLQFHVETLFPGAVQRHAPIVGVLEVCRGAADRTTLAPGDPSRIRAALLGCGHLTEPREEAERARAAGRLASGLIGRLEVGAEPRTGARTVRQWLQRSAGEEAPCGSPA